MIIYDKTLQPVFAVNLPFQEKKEENNFMKQKTRINLEKTVNTIAGEIGQRSYLNAKELEGAAGYIQNEFESFGYKVFHQAYNAKDSKYENVWVEKKGISLPDQVLVIGAHYDTVIGTPGADDNASGIAGLLELARLFSEEDLDKSIHFVAFTLEEPPFFRTRNMGSYVFAEMLNKHNRNVVGMICLESIGFFRNDPESQMFPLPFFRYFYPTTGNYIVFASNMKSKNFLNKAKEGFKKGSKLPVESISTFAFIPGVDFSDHRSFWKFGYDAFMVTDTAFYRNPNYHELGDTPDTLDYDSMAEVVLGLKASIAELGTSK